MKIVLILIIAYLLLFLYLYVHKTTHRHTRANTMMPLVKGIAKPTSAMKHRSQNKNKHTYGLTLRSTVPTAVKMALNSMNAPAVKAFKIPIQLPVSFDARDKWPGLITGPLNQADCGSCWAFSIATVSSDRYRIAYPDDADLTKTTQYRDGDKIIDELENFNPWHLASCNLCKSSPIGELLTKAGICNTDACVGQVLQVAMQYMRNNGLILTSCDPHQAPCIKDASACIYDCETNDCKTYKPKFFHQLDDSLAEQLGTERGKFNQYAIMTDGPLTIGISIYNSFETFFQDPANATKVYSNKIKRAAKEDALVGGHAVSIIGWGTDEDGTDFWLIRNSWGRDWADGGYFRIERGINFIGCGDDVWASHWGDNCKTCIDVILPGEPESA